MDSRDSSPKVTALDPSVSTAGGQTVVENDLKWLWVLLQTLDRRVEFTQASPCCLTQRHPPRDAVNHLVASNSITTVVICVRAYTVSSQRATRFRS